MNWLFGLFRNKHKIEVELVDCKYTPFLDGVVSNGKLPFKKNKTDAGFDLFATEDIIIQPGTVIKHPLDIRMKLPKGCYAEIKSKSGLGSKGLLVYAGVIDEEYRGIPHVVATNVVMCPPIPCNTSNKEDGDTFDPRATITIKKGEKIAQMVLYPYSDKYYVKQVKEIDTKTSRGTGGFGSTGK